MIDARIKTGQLKEKLFLVYYKIKLTKPGGKELMKARRKQYSAEFKQDAVNYYHSSGKSYEEVGKDLKISNHPSANWLIKQKIMVEQSTIGAQGTIGLTQKKK